MTVARLIAAILLGAAAIFAVLWWTRAPAPSTAAHEPAGAAATRPERPAAGAGTSAPAATPSTPGGTAPLVPVDAAARASIAMEFDRLHVPAEVLAKLAAGDVAGAVGGIRALGDDDAALALHRLSTLCVVRLGDTALDASQARALMAGDPDPATMQRVDAAIAAQRDWAARFRSGCESQGLLKSGSLRTEAEQRLRRCATRGNGECLGAIAVMDYDGSARSVERLRAAAMLGSADAQSQLLSTLEAAAATASSAPNAGGARRADTAEQRRARAQEIQYWREAVARSDPEWRATLLGCYSEDCDPARLDPAEKRRTLESAARDGSLGALAALATSERTVAESAAVEGAEPIARVPFVNPSETDAYAWKAVGERLATQGCLGFWPTWASYVGGASAAERELRPSQLAEARALAEKYWQQYGAPTATARGCGAP